MWNCKNNNAGIVVNTGPATCTVTQLNDNAHDYFTFRDSVVNRAVQDCAAQIMNAELDGELVATYLLTEYVHSIQSVCVCVSDGNYVYLQN